MASLQAFFLVNLQLYKRIVTRNIYFFESDFVDAGTSKLQACNVKKRAVLNRNLFEIFEILEHSFLPEHFRKSSRVSSPVGCQLWSYKFIKTKLSYIRFSGIFPKFLMQLFQNLHESICDAV